MLGVILRHAFFQHRLGVTGGIVNFSVKGLWTLLYIIDSTGNQRTPTVLLLLRSMGNNKGRSKACVTCLRRRVKCGKSSLKFLKEGAQV
jgi:hypothetical protein